MLKLGSWLETPGTLTRGTDFSVGAPEDFDATNSSDLSGPSEVAHSSVGRASTLSLLGENADPSPPQRTGDPSGCAQLPS